ncbi:hypothetical protein OCK02_07750 [Rhizobium sp. TRM96647]|uniref:hypothetical protein n=1 Tax=unclassified Rhizobium TaxID=2613769 RepID=UPI001E3A2584|nr:MULTISPECIES: hypothetical protein [unclassified Rhizobium]MCD2182934.1 hypothetical protein [Rhizobium sp. GN54]MCV3736095.1 hypothetical protein [Rhizobium sp. TRM96647]MCV3758243.1 hypothetical protein [Rhizobium sp. TRM96650]
MSSNVHHIEFRTGDKPVPGEISARVLKDMLHNAGYTTANLKPLAGPLHDASRSVLRRFLTLTMPEQPK